MDAGIIAGAEERPPVRPLSRRQGRWRRILVGSGSFYTTVDDLCRYERALVSNALISAASTREALTSGRTNDGRDTGCGLGWYVGSEESGTFADHEGEWDGFYSYICRYLDRPLSLFLLSNNPGLQLVDIANVAVSVYR